METETKINITLTLTQVRIDSNYINHLNAIMKQLRKIHGSVSLLSLIAAVHAICPELKQWCQANQAAFKRTTVKDKGLIGKIIEFDLFGNLPNSNSCPDTPYGDIKTTHFKNYKLNEKAFNAKERLTLTNFGDPNNADNIALISGKNSLMETKFYEKIKTGIVLVFQHDTVVYTTIESVYTKKIIAIVRYNLADVFEKHVDVLNVFQEDFDKIKKGIVEKNVTQRGQHYLHIHKHGCKGSVTRAFGFTNKFLTKLVAIYLQMPLTSIGRSDYIEF